MKQVSANACMDSLCSAAHRKAQFVCRPSTCWEPWLFCCDGDSALARAPQTLGAHGQPVACTQPQSSRRFCTALCRHADACMQLAKNLHEFASIFYKFRRINYSQPQKSRIWALFLCRSLICSRVSRSRVSHLLHAFPRESAQRASCDERGSVHVKRSMLLQATRSWASYE